MRFPAFVLLIAVAALAHGAEMYRWTDEKGVVNYTPYPPPPNIRKVEPKKLGDTGKATASEAPYSEQLAAKNFPGHLLRDSGVRRTVQDCARASGQARRALRGERSVQPLAAGLRAVQEIDERQSASAFPRGGAA